MDMITGMAVLASGMTFGGGLVVLYIGLVREATRRLAKENAALKNELFEEKLRSECGRAYRKGYRDGKQAPAAEKFAETFEGRRVKFAEAK